MIGGVLLGCLALYLVPRTAVLGAVLLTGYLGGAVCAQLRIEAPLFSNTLFPIYVGRGGVGRAVPAQRGAAHARPLQPELTGPPGNRRPGGRR